MNNRKGTSTDSAKGPPGEWRTYYGWRVVGVSTIIHGVMGGLGHVGLSVYFLPLARDFGVSHTKMSFAFALRTLEGGLEGPIIGVLVDRLGGRKMVLFGVLLGGIGFILMAATRTYMLFLIVFLGLVTVGMSVPHHGLFATINQWFRRRLGFAMSLAISGSGIGGAIITPIVAWIILNHGWRYASVFSGLLLLIIGLPLVSLVKSPQPGENALEDLNTGNSKPGGGTGDVGETVVQALDMDFSIGQALRTSTYWLLSFAIAMRLTGQQVLMVHIVPILVSRGISEGVAASLVALMSLMRLPSVLALGFLSDKWSREKMATVAMLSGTIAALCGIWGPDGVMTGIILVLFFSLAQGSNAITWALVGQYFGRKNFASLRGGISLFQSILSTGGPVAAGWIFDNTGSYQIALIGIGAAYLLGAITFWLLKTPPNPISSNS